VPYLSAAVLTPFNTAPAIRAEPPVFPGAKYNINSDSLVKTGDAGGAAAAAFADGDWKKCHAASSVR
jgi:hypothetical protein